MKATNRVTASACPRIPSILPALALLIAGAAIAPAAAPPADLHDGAYLNEISTAVETPHVKWLKPSARPAPRILFMVRRVWGNSTSMRQRDVVEIWQRLDLEFESFVYIHSEAERDRWEYNIAGSPTEEKWKEAARELAVDYDAIVLVDFDPAWLPEESRELLRRQVHDGTGLVLANDGRWPWPLEAVSDSTVFMKGVPLTQIPAYGGEQRAVGVATPAWDQAAAGVGAAYRYGAGRVARVRPGKFEADPENEVHLEYGMSLYIRALQHVVPGLEPAITWTDLPEGRVIPRSELPLAELPLTVRSTTARPDSYELRLAIRNQYNEVEHEESREVAVQPGFNSLAVPLPLLSAGRHFLDLWFHSDRGIEQYGSVGFTVSAPTRIDTITFDTPFHRQGDAFAEVSVALPASLDAAAEVRITATDTYGRRIADVSAPIQAGADAATVQLPLDLALAMAQWVRAELRRDGELLDADQELLIVGRTGPPDYPSILWNGSEGGLHGIRQLRRQREAGFNVCLSWADSAGLTARAAALGDMQMFVFTTGITKVSDGEAGLATNPDHMRKWKREVLSKHRETARYTPFIYSLGDESHHGGPNQPLGPSDVAEFQQFLQGRYRDLDDLNEVWGTSFSSFDQIEPIDWDTTGAAVHPQKHERASFIEMLYARMMHEMDDAITGMDPTARVGAEGSQPGDLELTLKGLETWGPYADRRFDLLLTSLAPPEMIRGMWWGGYHTGPFPRWKRINRLWTMTFEGVSNTGFFFDGLTGHHESNCSADMTWASYFERNLEDLRTFYETPAPLLAAATPYDQGVALLWSQASDHASGFIDERWQWRSEGTLPFPPTHEEMPAMFSVLDAAGVNYRFVTDRQVVRDGLHPDQVRLLLLPMTAAVSEPLVAELKAYVEHGGILLSVGASGVMDEHCRILDQGRFDHLLGLRRDGSPRATNADLSTSLDALGAAVAVEVAGIVADSSLRAAGADVIAAAADLPLLLVNDIGAGSAIHLNGSFADLGRRGQPGVDAARALVSALLGRAGVERLIRVEPPGAARVYSFQHGEVLLLSVIRGEDLTAPAAIQLEGAWHVYDSISRSYLGRLETLELPSSGRGFELYCLARKKLPEINADVARRAAPGELLEVRARLPGGSDRLVRMDLYDPDGAWLQHYRRFGRVDGELASFSVPFSYSDEPGDWLLRLTDVPSGQYAERSVQLDPAQ